jgi:hypothetical protein
MKLNKLIYGSILSLISYTAVATYGVEFAYGDGTNNTHAYRFGIQRAWSLDNLTPNKRKIRGYWDASFTRVNCSLNHLEAYAIAPVLRIPFRVVLNWYVDLGIGISYVSNQVIAARNLGSNWLFEDRAGVGTLLGGRQQYEIGYRFVHFSNAYTAQKNQSLNLHLLVLGYWF